jgi:hypothetical protein
MKRKEVSVDQFIEKILSLLDQKGIAFLIKTDDYLFDEFLIAKITENTVSRPDDQVLTIPNSTSCFVELNGKTYRFSFLERFDQQVLSKLTNQNLSNTTKTIYYLPKQVLHGFLERESESHWISSCLFLSEEIEGFSPIVLRNSLNFIFGENVSDRIQLYFSSLLESKAYSIGKLYFFASTYQTHILEWSAQQEKIDSKLTSLDVFLNGKGNSFLTNLPKSIPIETVEAFFRSFIRIDQKQIFISTLSQEQIKKLSQATENQAYQILELAISSTYQLLVEKENCYTFKIPEYQIEWKTLQTWIKNELTAYNQLKQLEALAQAYFRNTGTLLSKEQIDQIVTWKTESDIDYAWKEKYHLDEDLINSYLLLSQNHLEESLKKQQKKRSRLLKNSIRISIAVSIAFLLSSFTALIAYLERNSALKQQELAIQAKEDADQAREVAEIERMEAVKARQNESSALAKAEIDRLLALEAKGQSEIQKKNALRALEMAQKSETEASKARSTAEKNEKLAIEARETAQVNFKTSERLRNQQEARASALEALAHFANDDYPKGIQLAQTAYIKNLTNGGFPLQSDIFFALLYGNLNLEKNQLEVDLEFPAKFIALSTNKKQLAVYTINGEIRLYRTQPSLELGKVIKTGYLQSLEFASETQILITNLAGNLSILDLPTGSFELYTDQVSGAKYKSLYKIPAQENSWVATNQTGGVAILTYQKTDGFFKTKEKNGGKIQAMALEQGKISWAEGSNFYSSSFDQNDIPKLLFTAPTEISTITWSELHSSWILGLKGGQILVIHPERDINMVETFSIHDSKISQIKIIPYLHDTELMFSTGFDGSIYIYVLDKSMPFATSISSRISYPKHKSWITGFVIDSEQKLAYSISNDRSLKLWPLAIEELLSKN